MEAHEFSLYEDGYPDLSGIEQELADTVSEEEPWALVERFNELERVSGSDEERIAAEYLLDRLDALGIPNERFDPELWLSIPHEATLRTTSPVEESFDAVKTIAFSASGTASGEVVYVEGPQVDTMEEMLNAGVGDISQDVAGKIVLIEAMSLSTETITALQERGAAAFVGIHPHPEEPHEGIASAIWGAVPHPDHQDALNDMIIANVSRTVGDRLVELATDETPLEVEVSADLTTDWFECPLVLAKIPGEADPDEDDFVLLHGHYDSWHVGIADNATGDAGLLECARVFNEHRDQLRRDLWVAWWPGHSTGRYAGSTWFADEFAHDLVERCVAQVNMDSPGTKDATEFEDMTMWMPEADALCRSAIADVAGKETTENRPPRAGDYSFNNLGLSGLFMLSSNIPKALREERGYHPVGGCGGNSNAWHLTADTIDVADPDVLVRDVRVYVAALARLLTAAVVPLDHRHTVERHVEIVEGYDEAAGEHFDLAPVREELDGLRAAVESFHEAIEAGRADPEAANEAIKALSRSLVRVNFTSEGQYEQDPAIERDPYTKLAPVTELPDRSGDTYKFSRVHLKRAMNAVVADLRRARRAIPEVSQ